MQVLFRDAPAFCNERARRQLRPCGRAGPSLITYVISTLHFFFCWQSFRTYHLAITMHLSNTLQKWNPFFLKLRERNLNDDEEYLSEDEDGEGEQETVEPAWHHRLLQYALGIFSTKSTSQSNVPDNILAFRLITKMLESIPRPSGQPFPPAVSFAKTNAHVN